MPYVLATIHPLQTERERRMTTMKTARPLLKYSRLKICVSMLHQVLFY